MSASSALDGVLPTPASRRPDKTASSKRTKMSPIATCSSLSSASASSRRAVYEVVSGRRSSSCLQALAIEKVVAMVMRTVQTAMRKMGRSGCEQVLWTLRGYARELPSGIQRDLLNACLLKDRLRCYHNPTDCLALELWILFYQSQFTDVNVVHHAFAFPKTTNYPGIVRNLDVLLALMSKSVSSSVTPTTSFKLELKQCEIGPLAEDRVVSLLTSEPRTSFGASTALKHLVIPGLASDTLLLVIATQCTNLETLDIKGSRERVTDRGFARFAKAAVFLDRLHSLNVSRCFLTQRSLLSLRRFSRLRDLHMSTSLLDDISYSCEGEPVVLFQNDDDDVDAFVCIEKVAIETVQSITVEHESYVQVSINRVLVLLRNVFPLAKDVNLLNCIACELHVTLTQHPTNITFMREHVHTLELISADYFSFPQLVYPCPNLQSLCIEKPTNDLFNLDQQHVPLLYNNTVPFVNLKHLKLARIGLTNLAHFLSKSRNLKKFEVTNIGRRERPRWTDDRIEQILPSTSVPELREFHVSCLPNEGFSTADTHRYLHLTKRTVQYLIENFGKLEYIGGIESWTPETCSKPELEKVVMLGGDRKNRSFSITSI